MSGRPEVVEEAMEPSERHGELALTVAFELHAAFCGCMGEPRRLHVKPYAERLALAFEEFGRDVRREAASHPALVCVHDWAFPRGARLGLCESCEETVRAKTHAFVSHEQSDSPWNEKDCTAYRRCHDTSAGVCLKPEDDPVHAALRASPQGQAGERER